MGASLKPLFAKQCFSTLPCIEITFDTNRFRGQHGPRISTCVSLFSQLDEGLRGKHVAKKSYTSVCGNLVKMWHLVVRHGAVNTALGVKNFF